MKKEYTFLTQNQKLIWLGQELNPESPIYNMVMAYEIKGSISFTYFKSAFNKLVAKSDALRSVFKIKEGEPIQKYLKAIDFEIEFIDFSNNDDPRAKYEKWLEKRVVKQFNLEQCLFDCVLIKLKNNIYVWYINQHHLITDGWSTSLVFSEMAKLYKEVQERKINEDNGFYTYQNYAANQEQNIKTKRREEVIRYWKEKSKNNLDKPNLYFKKQQPLNTSSERSLINLGKERSDKIRELANTDGIKSLFSNTTLANIFLTTLYAFVYRVSGQQNIQIGSPIHNRISKDLKNTIGFFVEIFPLFVKLDENESFFSLFKKIQIENNLFLKNAQTGTSSAELNRGFNIFYNYINTINPDFNGFEVKTSWLHSGHSDPRHKIRLHIHDFDNTGEIKLYFDLNTILFNAEERAIIPQHFLVLLDAFIQNKEQEIDKISLITPYEKKKIKNWNNTEINYGLENNLLSEFEKQVLNTPNNIALKFKKETLTYKEFNEKSNQVAHFLLSKNVQHNDVVIVSLERSLDMMIYIYGILKVGAIYLPVDTEIPSKRLNFIVNDAKAKILFYNHNNIKNITKNEIHSYDVSILKDKISSLETTKIENKIEPDNLAYIIYTSGSTGKPKGVKCTHKGICNRLNWMNDDHPITSKDVFLQKTPITFDVSVWELFWPLQKGASLVIEIPDGHKNPEGIRDTIINNKVSYIHFVPSMLEVFIASENITNCKSLKTLFCSGEALSTNLVNRTQQILDTEIYNLYGPTEASIDVTSYKCNKGFYSNNIPIGYPVANTKLYIVDKHMNLSPIGIPGELHITGLQVAEGYLNRDKLTNEYFLDDVFSDNPNSKLYKTGDLVRYREDGAIEYIGRIDTQIKLRGQRIELGEIEQTLEKQKQISRAVVLLDDKKNLIAFYTGTPVNPDEVKAYLESKLPSYMIPSSYIYQEEFELLTSGKINRKILIKNRSDVTLKNEKVRVAPKNEIEKIVHKIWKKTLEIEEIGIYENFIRIGGNSLIAISITSRIKESLELEVSINSVFNYPTIESYSKYIEETITKLLEGS